MTGIERLRDVCKALKGSPWFITEIATIGREPAYEKLREIADQIEREIDEAVADEVADTLSAYEMNTNARWYSAVEEGAKSDCKDEYEMISRYWLPRPRFEDGTVAINGHEFEADGKRMVICDMCVLTDGSYKILCEDQTVCAFKAKKPLKRPEPPDTWERVEADADKSVCGYFGKECESCGTETECPARNSDSCSKFKAKDIVRRCKKLAGVE